MPGRAVRALPQLVLLGALGCSRGGDPLAWISERSAVVRCASPGKRPPPPAMIGVPAPLAPTGLLTRQLDPVGLDALGFTREATVCATLEVPSAAEIDAAGEVRSILALHDTTSREAMRAGGRCTCEVARSQGVRDLIAACVQTPTVGGCDPVVDADRVRPAAEKVAAAVAPLVAALDDVVLPWTHWRLVGPTDRPGWFAAHLDAAIANHDGGSVVYLPGDPMPSRTDPVVRAMLGMSNVVAVVRQDGGRALLVARELEGLLVLDHFRQPLASPERMPLVARIEAANVSAMADRLAQGTTRKTMVAPGDGTLIEIDRLLLEEIDRSAVVMGPLFGITAEPPRAKLPPALFDRIAFVAPYGESGTVLRTLHVLSAEGIAWAQTLTDTPLVGNLGALGLAPNTLWPALAEPTVASPTARVPERFVLRGTATERWAIHGVHRFGVLANLLEIAVPGSIAGDVSAWRIDWPGVTVPNELTGGEPVFEGVRTLMSARPYRLEAAFDRGRTTWVVEARSR